MANLSRLAARKARARKRLFSELSIYMGHGATINDIVHLAKEVVRTRLAANGTRIAYQLYRIARIKHLNEAQALRILQLTEKMKSMALGRTIIVTARQRASRDAAARKARAHIRMVRRTRLISPPCPS